MVCPRTVRVFQEQDIGFGCACRCNGMKCRIERESQVPQLLRGVCKSGIETSHQPAVILQGYLPYPKESQEMVYAVGIKVIGHLAKTVYKPGIAVACHVFPIVSGHSPFLAIYGKSIRRCTGLTISIEQFGMYPYITTMPVDPDRDVAFQKDPFAVCVFFYIAQLPVKMELYEIMLAYLTIPVIAGSAVFL